MVRQRRQGGAWYYQFIRNGKRYAGRCEAVTKREAEAYERRIMATVERASEQKTVKALIDNFRDELTGGKKIALDEAFELAEQKPRSRIPAEKYAGMKRTAWGDFLAFMHGEHPDVENLIDVTEAHAQEYISILPKNGRYEKKNQLQPGVGEEGQDHHHAESGWGVVGTNGSSPSDCLCRGVHPACKGCRNPGQSFFRHRENEIGHGNA